MVINHVSKSWDDPPYVGSRDGWTGLDKIPRNQTSGGMTGRLTHRIHGTGIFTYIYHKSKPSVGKYSIPLDPKTMKNEGFKPSKYGS